MDGKDLLPSFIIIGAPRCATTSLYEVLRRHPNIYMPTVKEPDYFSKKKENRDKEEYSRLFKNAKEGQEIGEASTSYFYTPHSAQDISSTLPNVKIIAQLRDPVDRAYSQYRLRKNSGLDQRGFLKAVKEDKKYTEEQCKPQTGYYYRSKYYTHVSRYFESFDRKNILITYFDTFVKNTNETLRKIADFLGIDQSRFRQTSLHYNSSKTSISKSIENWIREDSATKKILQTIIPKDIRRKIIREVYRMQKSKKDTNKPDIKVKNEVRKLLQKDLKKLSKLIGGKSKKWIHQ